jgi:anti-sigma factor RsiW
MPEGRVQCAESLRVQAYFDGEVDAVSALDIERHTEHCDECRALLLDLERTRERIRRELDYGQAPAALRARIVRMLADETQLPAARAGDSASPLWRRGSFWVGATGGLGAALAAVVVFVLVSAVPSAALRDELANAHVRALMSGHLTDVVSTDQHTVKPWFAGRADISPVVADFAAQGYPLLGGRADYLDRQRAAVLVYRHGAHVIDVFAWAGGGRVLAPHSTRAGYHLVAWRVGDLEYCAVSDAGWDELVALQRLLRERAVSDSGR